MNPIEKNIKSSAVQPKEAQNIKEASNAKEAQNTKEASNAKEALSQPTQPHPAAKEFSPLLKHTGIHFLEFALGFLSLAKCHYQPGQEMKVNSLPFFALIALDSWAEQDYTMSELADKLNITKQQLSHMIKVLEERGLVERIHDTANRRRVYIRICDSGREIMNQMKQDMLSSTLSGLRGYTQEELTSMDECLCRLMKLMEKFNAES